MIKIVYVYDLEHGFYMLNKFFGQIRDIYMIENGVSFFAIVASEYLYNHLTQWGSSFF